MENYLLFIIRILCCSMNIGSVIFHSLLLSKMCISLFVIPYTLADLSNNFGQKELDYSIREESDVGSFIGNLKVDTERKFLIAIRSTDTFELYDYSDMQLFRLEPMSGKLFVAARIDRETICPQPETVVDRLTLHTSSNYVEELTSKDSDTCQIHLTVNVAHTYWINVIVTIHDVNDHEPFFPIPNMKNQSELEESKSTYIVNVSESVSPGYEVPLIRARDPDVGPNTVQSYSLRGIDFDSSIFSISFKKPYTLNLVILNELDAEVKKSYSGELVACDGGQPIPKCANQPFVIQITDLNDNKPVFNQSVYEVEISENLPINSTILKLCANDADSGVFGQVTYKFGRPLNKVITKHFEIKPENGEIYVKSRLDAKENRNFIIPVLAQDGGSIPLIGQAIVQINVKDTNDHSPWIELRRTQQLHETVSQDPSQKSKPPESNHHNQTGSVLLSINENQPIGTNIGLIIAGDEDIGSNSEVTCRLKDERNRFYLEHANSAKGREIYRLNSNQTFDRESFGDPFVKVIIQCTDNGEPKLSTERVFTVEIIDLNEFRPEFSSNNRVINHIIPEEQPLETFVLRIEAIDKDATPIVQYYLSREAQAYFHIDPETGVITIRSNLDRETMPQIRFQVYATDQSSAEIGQSDDGTVANITIHLSDINDNAPELVETRSFQIVENRPGFSDLIGQLSSVDHDNGNNGTVNYKLLAVTSYKMRVPTETFMINSESGKIFASKRLDREASDRYELTVLLHDLGTPNRLNSTQTIIIDVLDENDNAPTWGIPTFSNSQFSYIREQNKFQHRPLMLGLGKIVELGIMNITFPLYRGQQIMMLTANDSDASYNANLTFYLINAYSLSLDQLNNVDEVSPGKKDTILESSTLLSSGYFSLTVNTGELVVGPGPRSIGLTDPGVFELYLRVSDNGNPPLDSTARLFIQVYPSANSLITGRYEGKGFISYLLSTGQLGIAIIIVLIFIMCLTSICLVIAFLSIKRRGGNRSQANKRIPPGGSTLPIQLNADLYNDGTMQMDGTINNLNKIYHTPLLKEGESLYRWSPDCAYSVGNFGPPPIYNLCAFNTTLDRMRSSHTGSDKSGTALISSEIPCPVNQIYEDSNNIREINTLNAPKTPQKFEMMDDRIKLPSNLPEMNTEQYEIHGEQIIKGLTSDAVIPHANTSEIDRGSADSGQGASEDEPVNSDACKNYSKSPIAILPSKNMTFVSHSSTLPMFNAHSSCSPKIKPQEKLSVLGRSRLSTDFPVATVSTFTNATQYMINPSTLPFDKLDTNNSTCSPHSSNDDCWQPRWRRPLFTNADLGHHNHLFDEFPNGTSSPSKQSSTLPPTMKYMSTTDCPNSSPSVMFPLKSQHLTKAGTLTGMYNS